MKKLSFVFIACAAVFVITACNEQPTDAIKSANESNEIIQDSAEQTPGAVIPFSEADSKFAVDLASSGMKELQLGELAQQKATSQQVKDFTAMLVNDHARISEELKNLAALKSITLPPAPGEADMNDIKDVTAKTGTDFDKAFMKKMVEEHEKNINAFETIGNQSADPDLRAFVTKNLPALKAHLETANSIKDALK